jgi:hypothetical protein
VRRVILDRRKGSPHAWRWGWLAAACRELLPQHSAGVRGNQERSGQFTETLQGIVGKGHPQSGKRTPIRWPENSSKTLRTLVQEVATTFPDVQVELRTTDEHRIGSSSGSERPRGNDPSRQPDTGMHDATSLAVYIPPQDAHGSTPPPRSASRSLRAGWQPDAPSRS